MSNKERQKKFRDGKKERGLVLLRLWIKPEWKQAIMDYVNKVNKDKNYD